MSIPDPYKILQVDPEAEDEVIEAAYKRLARKYHPDVAAGPDAQDRMVRINQAWELLRDPVRRAAVDRARARAAAQAARVAAADAQARAAPVPRYSPGAPAHRRQGSRPGQGVEPPATTWPMPGMRDPADETPPATRSGWPPADAGAGPPPGNPSGSVLNFGRFAGWSLGEVARVEPEYLEWLDRMPIGRMYQQEIDGLLRRLGLRTSPAPGAADQRGLFRRR